VNRKLQQISRLLTLLRAYGLGGGGRWGGILPDKDPRDEVPECIITSLPGRITGDELAGVFCDLNNNIS
jgi:hypothetical protein